MRWWRTAWVAGAAPSWRACTAAEQTIAEPLPPYGACLLGSINLARLVRQPFTPDAHIDPDELSNLGRSRSA